MATVTRSQAPDAAEEAWRLLFQVAKAKHAVLSARLVELDLTHVQAHALRLLDPSAPLAMSELADALYCHASNVTGIVDRLESRGLVERRPGLGDRRVKTLALTRRGRRRPRAGGRADERAAGRDRGARGRRPAGAP